MKARFTGLTQRHQSQPLGALGCSRQSWFNGKTNRAGRQVQRGAVAVVFGLTLTVMIGFIGLAVDLGRFFVIKAELQNAVDACALSAASQLRPGAGDDNALVRAVAYGQVFSANDGAVVTNAWVKNTVNFQSSELVRATLQISFSATNDGSYSTSTGAGPANTARFVKCEYPLAGLPIYFMKVLNPLLSTQTVTAAAVATRDAPTSACIPIAVCGDAGGPITTGGHVAVGNWITIQDQKNTDGTSALPAPWEGWVDATKTGGGSRETLDLLESGWQCDVSRLDEFVVSRRTGTVTNLNDPWNSRFGWYDSPVADLPTKAATSPPDKTGFAYSNEVGGNWLSGSNAYADFKTHQSNFTAYQSDAVQPPGFPNPGGQYNALTGGGGGQYDTLGVKDRRVVSAAVLNCPALSSNSATTPVLAWACVLMLNPFKTTGSGVWRQSKLEYLGLANSETSPCASGELNIATVLTQ